MVTRGLVAQSVTLSQPYLWSTTALHKKIEQFYVNSGGKDTKTLCAIRLQGISSLVYEKWMQFHLGLISYRTSFPLLSDGCVWSNSLLCAFHPSFFLNTLPSYTPEHGRQSTFTMGLSPLSGAWWIQYLALRIPLWFLVEHTPFAPAWNMADVVEGADLAATAPARKAVDVAHPPGKVL